MDVDDEDFLDDDDDDVGRAHGTSQRRTRAEKGKGKATAVPGERRQHAAAGPEGYSWEADYERTWDAVQEDATGSLEGAVYDFLQQAKRRRCALIFNLRSREVHRIRPTECYEMRRRSSAASSGISTSSSTSRSP